MSYYFLLRKNSNLKTVLSTDVQRGGQVGQFVPGPGAPEGPGGPEPQRIPTGPGPEEKEWNVE